MSHAPYGLITLVVGPLATNCYLFFDSTTKETLIIDPGAESAVIAHALTVHNLHPVAIINTHGHADHIGANKELKKRYSIPVRIHTADAVFLGDSLLNGSGLIGSAFIAPAADGLLEGGQTLMLGALQLKVIHTPGHTPGGICLTTQDLLFSGDTLFFESIGRWDLPGGDGDVLMRSLSVFKHMNAGLQVLPGHGSKSSIAHEMSHNPFLQ